MKEYFYKLFLVIVCLKLASCASPTDPTFMNNAAASINGGEIIMSNGSRSFTSGTQISKVHPFFH